MKRYVCTVAVGFVLALVGTGTATAGILPVADQTGTQATTFGDQSVGEQKNDADVTQSQGNGNINIAPAIAIFGDAETSNEQGNDNTAIAVVDQSNSVDQSQSSIQEQSLEQDGGSCCDGQSQAGEQSTSFGDQSVGEQKNDADVNQYQGNGNINVAPAIAIFGDAKTTNEQGNGNAAVAVVDQSNSVDQSQSSIQKQSLEQDGGACCTSKGDGPSRCAPKWDWVKHGTSCKRQQPWPVKDTCCGSGPSQTAEQTASFGDQSVGKQRNDAEVTQKQGNGNLNLAPAVSLGGKKGDSCDAKCTTTWKPTGGGAETTNSQGNGNVAVAWVGQSNSVDQSQVAYQQQDVVDLCKGLVTR
jgi:hypothetical protein